MRNVGFFAQNRWTIHRVTLQGGGRYENAKSNSPEQGIGPEPSRSRNPGELERTGQRHRLVPRTCALGEPSGNVATVPINILTAGEFYGDRVTQVDMRIAKLLKFGRMRTNVGVDIYNLFNSNVALGYFTTYCTTWGRANSVLDARFAKISAQFDF